MMDDRERLILLNLIPGLGSATLRRLLDGFGGVDRLWAAGPEELQQAGGITPLVAQRLAAGRQDDGRLARELSLAQRAGAQVVTLADADYPAMLRTIHDPPVVLYVRGALNAEEPAVAVVGSRSASLYGLQCAEHLSEDLALRGIAVVSGLARGIDAAAHRGALKASGRTIAVLGSGLNRLYPPEHDRLAAQIAQQGAVISEFSMETLSLPQYFPRRNRIISGLSLGVVVVEAAHRSGALITADCALEQGREVFAVPGPMTAVTSQGTHHLLKQGARLVTSVEDILEELRLVPEPAQAAQDHMAVAALSGPAQRVAACVSEREPRHLDAIAAASGLAVSEASALLLDLELRRMVQQLPGKRFVKR